MWLTVELSTRQYRAKIGELMWKIVDGYNGYEGAISDSVDTKALVYYALGYVGTHLIPTLMRLDLQARSAVLVIVCWLNGIVGVI